MKTSFHSVVRRSVLFLLLPLLFLSCSGKTTAIADGTYTIEVTLGGGSGRAFVQSPVRIEVTDGSILAEIEWSSPFYEYMIAEGKRFDPIQTSGNAVFRIPVRLDTTLEVSASTVAMSEPHLIDYTLYFDSSTLERSGS